MVGSLGRIMQGRSVSMEVKRDLRNTVIVPTLAYASQTWTWNESQRSRVQAVEMSYLRTACGMSRMDGMSNESVWVCGRKKKQKKESYSMCMCGGGGFLQLQHLWKIVSITCGALAFSVA